MTLKLVEIGRETYGPGERADNRYSERRYRADDGRLYILSRNLDGRPPFFAAYGPFTEDWEEVLPEMSVGGQGYWGDGWSWKQAVAAFCREIGAEVTGSVDGARAVLTKIGRTAQDGKEQDDG